MYAHLSISKYILLCSHRSCLHWFVLIPCLCCRLPVSVQSLFALIHRCGLMIYLTPKVGRLRRGRLSDVCLRGLEVRCTHAPLYLQSVLYQLGPSALDPLLTWIAMVGPSVCPHPHVIIPRPVHLNLHCFYSNTCSYLSIAVSSQSFLYS